MIVLADTNDSLEVVLAGAITTNQLPITAAWVDRTTSATTAGQTNTQTNNTTAVTAVAAPAASTQRAVDHLTVYNADTVSATVTVRLNDNSATRILVRATLAAGDTLEYTHAEGFRYLNTAGQLKTSAANTNTNTQTVTVANVPYGVTNTTASGTVSLTSASTQTQNIDPNGSDRNVDAGASSEFTGNSYLILNTASSGTSVLKFRNSSSVQVGPDIPWGQSLFVQYDGSAWRAY